VLSVCEYADDLPRWLPVDCGGEGDVERLGGVGGRAGCPRRSILSIRFSMLLRQFITGSRSIVDDVMTLTAGSRSVLANRTEAFLGFEVSLIST